MSTTSFHPANVFVLTTRMTLNTLFFFNALGCEGIRGLKAKRNNVKTTGMTRGPVRRYSDKVIILVTINNFSLLLI